MLPLLGPRAPARRNRLMDWLGALPERHMGAFKTVEQNWDTLYVMGSVALHGAKDLAERREFRTAAQQVGIAGELLNRMSGGLIAASEIMQDEARHFAVIPAVEPSELGTYRSSSARWIISMAIVRHQFTFGERNRFFNKLRSLDRAVELLCQEFLENAEMVVERRADLLGLRWEAFERLHDDLNTCLREDLLILKCFLRALPKETAPQIIARLEAPTVRVIRPVHRTTEVSV